MLLTPQAVKKTQQNVKGSNIFYWGVIALLIIFLPVAAFWISNVSLETARKYPVDETNPHMKEVHERNMVAIIAIFILSITFLTFYYIVGHKFFPTVIFYGVIFAIAFSLMTTASDAIKKIKDAGKKDEYKSYMDLLITITFFSTGIVMITGFIILYTLYSFFRGTKKQNQQ